MGPNRKRTKTICRATYRQAQIRRHGIGVGGGAGAAVVEGQAGSGAAGGQRILPGALPRLADQVAEGGQGDELARREEVGEGGHTVVWRFEVSRIVRQFGIRFPCRPRLSGDFGLLRGRSQVDSAPMAFSDDRHQTFAHATSLPFTANVGEGHRYFTDKATRSPTVNGIRGRRTVAVHDLKLYGLGVVIDHWLDPRLLARLG
ncbi:MAG: hypothetical protein H0V24_18660 [Chloroflexia bacterium]|nr:hypothetical protein [Chloroflexia bacterium]